MWGNDFKAAQSQSADPRSLWLPSFPLPHSPSHTLSTLKDITKLSPLPHHIPALHSLLCSLTHPETVVCLNP